MDNTSEAEFDTKFLDTIREILDQEMNPEVKELRYVSDDSPDQVAENLALKISQNALPDDGKIAPRFLGGFLKSTSKAVVGTVIKEVLKKVDEHL